MREPDVDNLDPFEMPPNERSHKCTNLTTINQDLLEYPLLRNAFAQMHEPYLNNSEHSEPT